MEYEAQSAVLGNEGMIYWRLITVFPPGVMCSVPRAVVGVTGDRLRLVGSCRSQKKLMARDNLNMPAQSSQLS